jgi:hypothetical protein
MKPTLLCAAALLTLTGCVDFPLSSLPGNETAGFVPVNHRGDIRLPAEIQRVAVLPVHGGTVTEGESAGALDPVVVAGLQRQLRFEVVTISRDDCRALFGAESFGSTDALPHGMLEKIAAKYAVDAVLFTDLTVYHPYRPLAIGLRSKLATLQDVRLVWAFDEVFSAGDDAMITSVKEFYRKGDRTAPVDATPAVLQSPARFGAVAADLMFRTLPPR